jgi:hypothetical protein
MSEQTQTQEDIIDLSVNLDMLSAPEGSDEADIASMVANLPNLDDSIQTQQPNNQAPITNQGQDVNSNQNLTSYIDKVKKRYEEFGYEIPEDLNETNAVDRLDALYDAVRKDQTASNLHPEVEKLQKAIESGIKPEDFYKTMKGYAEIEDMPSHDVVRASLKQNFGKSDKRPNGWDEDKIESTIRKMDQSGLLEIEAEKIRTEYQERKLQAADEMIKQQNYQRQQQFTQMTKQRDDSIKSALGYFNKLENINGLPISQSEKSEFVEQFRYLVTPDEKKGVSPMLEMLQSDETLVKVAYFLSKGDAKIREQLTRSKEYAKNDFLNKLDPEPKITQSRGGFPSTEIDFDALAAPSQF